MTEKKFSMNFTIHNFVKLSDQRSPSEIHCGLKCYFKASKFFFSDDWHLQIEFTERTRRKRSRNYMESVEGTMFFLNPTETKICVEKREYDYLKNVINFSLSGNQNFQKTIERHMVDGSVTVRCDVIIKRNDWKGKMFEFSIGNPMNVGDVTLVVEDREFYVSKHTLANISPYFKTMFFERFHESTESKITLKDVDANDFQALLEVIYHKRAIESANAPELLELVHYFDMKDIEKQCIDIIAGTTEKEISMQNKIYLADEFMLPELLEKCMSSIKSISELHWAIPREIDELSKETMAKLLHKVISTTVDR